MMITTPNIFGKTCLTIPHKSSMREYKQSIPSLKQDMITFSANKKNGAQELKNIYSSINHCLDCIECAETEYKKIKNFPFFKDEIDKSDSPAVVKAKIYKISAQTINTLIFELNCLVREQENTSNPLNVIRCAKDLLDILSINLDIKTSKPLAELDKIYERAQTYASYALEEMDKQLLSPALKKMIPDVAVKILASPDTSHYTADSLHNVAWDHLASQEDPSFKNLKDLSTSYKKAPPEKTRSLFAQILHQEEQILVRELLCPEKFVTSALLSTYRGAIPSSQQELLLLVRKNALFALQQFQLVATEMDLPTQVNNYMPALMEILRKPNYATPMADDLEMKALNLLVTCYQEFSKKNKTSAEVLALKTYYSSPNKDSRRKAFCLFESQVPPSSPRYKHMEKYLIEEFKQLPLSEKHTALINLGKLESKELERIIPKLLSNQELPFQLKRAAVWSAGLSMNDNNFNHLVHFLASLKETHNSSEAEKRQLTEMALSSLSEYAKKDVYRLSATKLIEEFTQKKGMISLVATDLLEKLNKMDEKPNFYINKAFGTDHERANNYIQLRNKLIPSISSLDHKNCNYIDKALIPFNNTLPALTDQGVKIIFSNSDPITLINKNAAGSRTNDGRFLDFINGVCSNTEKIILACVFYPDQLYNIFAHEFAHLIDHTYISDNSNTNEKIENLYRAATNPNDFKERCLNFYAATTRKEYLAEGYEAFTSVTKPHHSMIQNMDFEEMGACTISTLLNKDPALYKCIYDLTVQLGGNAEKYLLPPITKNQPKKDCPYEQP